MRIAVVAAGGRSGQAFVRRALAAGHTVRAGVHRSDPFAGEATMQSKLTVIRCDAANPDDVASLLDGCDTVVSFIGHVRGQSKTAADIQTVATKNIIDSMSSLGIYRIVSLTGTGVRLPGDIIGLIDRLLNLGLGFVDKQRITDGRRHFELLQASRLDWTVIRVLKLQYSTPKAYSLSEHGPAKTIVSRDEVASAVLQVLDGTRYVGVAPVIGRP